MANEFEAKIEVDTSGAAKDLKSVDTAVDKLDSTLNSLDKTLNRFQGTLSKTTTALQAATRAQRESDGAADKSAASVLKLAQAREKDSRAALNAARTEAIATRERSATARANETAANSFQGVTGAVRGYSQGARDADQSTLALAGSMSNTRYLLYDIGATYRAISIALLAIPTATTAVAASFEKDFAQVERTTVGTTANMGELKNSLQDLTTQIPLSFSEMSKIASLGAQLGISAENLSSFTETVAKFSAATGVSAEEAGSAFGRIGSAFNLDASEYEKLGSAIAKVGVSSAATETEIIAITQQLAPLAKLAGFSAEEVVGLSGALASMRIRPELARGAFQATIFKITDAAENGGAKLQAYADIMGTTGDRVRSLVTGKNADPATFFREYITGIGKAMEGGRSFSSILDELGVKEKRERQFILSMANQYGFLGEQIDLANKAYNDGTFLDQSSAKVFETFSANLTKLGNALANLGEGVGAGGLGILSQLVQVMTQGAVAINDFVRANPELGKILSVLMGFGAVVGVFFAIRTAMAFVMAAMVGFQQVAGKAALQTTFSLKGIAAQAAVTALVTKGATTEMAANHVRQYGTMIAMNSRFVAATATTQASIVATGGKFRSFGGALLSAVGGPIGIIIGALGVLTLGFVEAQQKAQSAGQAIGAAMNDGAKEAVEAASAALTKIDAGIGSGLEFGNFGKNLVEISKEAGISFDVVVASAAKGKAGLADFNKAVDDLARAKGYKDLQDMAQKNPFKWTEEGQQLSKLDFLKKKLAEVAAETDKTKMTSDTADAAVKKLTGNSDQMKEFGDETEGTSSKFDVLKTNIEEAAQAAFGMVNAGAAANDALYKLGQSLQESSDFGINSEGGRANLDNAQNAVTKYAMSLAQQRSQDKITAEQMAADYKSYLDGLYSELLNRGVDPGQAQEFINQAKMVMQTSADGGTPVTVPIKADGSQAEQVAGETAQKIQGGLDAAAPTAKVEADTTQADTSIGDLAYYAAMILGQPFIAPVTADTESGVQNIEQFGGYAHDSIERDPFIAPVTADTTSGQQNLLNFASWARNLLNGIQAAIAIISGNLASAQNAASSGRGMTKMEKPAQAAPQQSAPVNIPAPTPDSRPNSALKNLGQGYDDAAAKAAKAGDAGKKAGKDAADGINDAAKAVDDYAQRLQTGLTAAFDAQHGLGKATDDYYTALNAINKKRKDDLKTIQDHIDKQKELNNARQGDLVAARKAQIEADISKKYGETDRAADYEQQAEEARLAAAEKQKNIDTSRDEQAELERGMYALDGYSQAAIDNRNALRDLESKMIGMISAYAATGASQNQVAAYAANLTRTFGIQVTQMGYNQGSVNALIGTTQRYIDVIYRVPQRVHTDSSNDFGAGANDARGLSGAINAIPNSHNTKFTADAAQFFDVVARIGVKTSEAWDNIGKAKAKAVGVEAGPAFRYTGGIVGNGYASGGLIPGTPPSDPTKDNLLAKVDGKGLVHVRSKEFIQPEPAVDYYGLPFMEAIRNMTLPRYNVGGPVGMPKSSASTGGGGVQLVELTAENIQMLLRLADRPIVMYADAQQIAASANEGNKILASKGVKN